MDAVRISNIARHIAPPIVDELAPIDTKEPGVELSWPSQIGSKYQAYWTNDMEDSWTAAGTEVTAEVANLSWVDKGDTARMNPGSDTVSKRFYAAVQTATSWDVSQEFTADTYTVALYHLEDGSETVDASSNGFDLTAYDISDTHFVAGKFGDAIDFSDSYTYLAYPNAYGTQLDVPGVKFTIEAWVKFEDPIESVIVIQHDGYYSLGISSNPLGGVPYVYMTVWGEEEDPPNPYWSIGSYETGYVLPRDGQYHHVAGIFDGVNQYMYIYVDGIKRAESYTLITIPGIDDLSSPFGIGSTGSGDPFPGMPVDEVRISSIDRRETDLAEPLPVQITKLQTSVEVSWASSPFSVYRLYWSPTDIRYSSPGWELCSEIATLFDTETVFLDSGDPAVGRPAPPLEEPVNRHYKLILWREW